MLFLILILGIAVALYLFMVKKPSQTTQTAENTSAVTITPVKEVNTPTPAVSKYTLADIAKHNTEEDCWLLIEDKVYDVSEFIPNHPGGKAILQGCGKDATVLFKTRPMGSNTPHSPKAQNIRENYYIGDFQK